jgi:thiamine-phosphate pyrophosphorylase
LQIKSQFANRNSQISPLPRLCAIVDADSARQRGWDPVDLACACWDGGGRFLQIRAKQASSRDLLTLVDAVIAALRARGAGDDTIVIVNDRPDIARLSGASGVHVGQDDVRPADARRILVPGALVGLSTHTTAQIESARDEPVDYIAIGPVFGTRTKDTGYEAVGLPRVSEAAAGSHPVVAIGGITLDNAPSVIQAGAASVAVISDLLTGGHPERRVRAYLDALARV